MSKTKEYIETMKTENDDIDVLSTDFVDDEYFYEKYLESLKDMNRVFEEKEELLYANIKLGMTVVDELGRKGRIIANDDVDNIMVRFNKDHVEYFSLREDNPDGISKLYRG
jgi:hypothetical protein